MKNTTTAHLALLAANLIYGVNYTMAKIALPDYVQPFAFIVIRVSVAMALFWVVWLSFVRERVERKDILRLMACGLFGVAANQSLFFLGLARTTEINASLIMITTPILVLVLSHFLLKEHINLQKVLGILLGAAGAYMLIGKGKLAIHEGTGLGDLFVLLNAASYAFYLVLVKPLMQKYRPVTIISWVFLFGFLYTLPVGWQQFRAVAWDTFTWEVWASVIYVVVGTTFLAYMLNIFALSRVNPSIVSVYIYLQPLIATMVALSIGSDQLTVLKVLAGLLIFAGVWLASRKGRDERVQS